MINYMPEFVVLTSLIDDEEEQKDACLIVLDTQKDVEKFADYLERETLLTVDELHRLSHFYFTYDRFYNCSVLKVSIKDEISFQPAITSVEQVAIAETYSFYKSQEKTGEKL